MDLFKSGKYCKKCLQLNEETLLVRLLNKGGAFKKEGQGFTFKIYIVQDVGLNSLKVQGNDKIKAIKE